LCYEDETLASITVFSLCTSNTCDLHLMDYQIISYFTMQYLYSLI
jgi:hypothetical protein